MARGFPIYPGRSRIFPAARFLVGGGPGAAFGLVFRHAPALIALFYMLGLALLLVGISGLVPARHDELPSWPKRKTLAKGVGFLRGSVRLAK
jgi:hypothetical protein